ncbi:prepilin-type cleavage/methylation domain-containing protein [Campylobacter sp. MIT 99-7217]|uniref:type II secretion system protein n=1 Tax=Campylobacter sp. MIT 99-7217 TaxID=535091 RepID=UPI00115AD31B|nr:type II secretion system protein [Campylobacter sp. MIT 99-7217]TQR33846.1 prepilin-type cleavage/methylation domain-containing protein [Campylobacter sp. MIT 99-7217]
MKKAFTVLELIFVIVILGILAAIALPKFSSSKDDSEISKSLINLKTAISDLTQYALKNDSLTLISSMSNVSSLENIDLSNISANAVAKFKVGNDDECLKFIFINKGSILLFGIASNDNTKALIENIADLKDKLSQNPNDNALKTSLLNANNALSTANFTSTSSNKACVSLSNSQSFKDLASKTYTLLGN